MFLHSAYPRPLHEKATRRSVWRPTHWNRANPPASPGPPPRGLGVAGWEPSAREERLELLLDKARHALADALVRRVDEERLQLLAHDTVQHVRRGIARVVVDRRKSHGAGRGTSCAGGGDWDVNGPQVRTARTARRWTQAALATRLGVSQRYV